MFSSLFWQLVEVMTQRVFCMSILWRRFLFELSFHIFMRWTVA